MLARTASSDAAGSGVVELHDEAELPPDLRRMPVIIFCTTCPNMTPVVASLLLKPFRPSKLVEH